jgi:ABC-type antimicrobial peptide transport system permease subunit
MLFGGIYGAVAYTVEQRAGEIGIRMALGAQTRDVLKLVVNQGMKPVIMGLAIGIAAAFALGRLLTSQLFEVSAQNPALLGGATVCSQRRHWSRACCRRVEPHLSIRCKRYELNRGTKLCLGI